MKVAGLVKKELKENRWKYLIIIIYLVIIGGSLPWAFRFLSNFVTGFIGLESELVSRFLGRMLDDYYIFAWANWYGKNLYQGLTVFAIILGMTNIAGEVGRGTASFLFSKPLSRKTIYLVKYSAGLLGLGGVIVASTVVTLLASRIYGEPLPFKFLAGIPLAFAGSLVVYSLTVYFSGLADDQVKAAAAAGVAALVISIPSWFAPVQFLSVYVQMQGWPVFSAQGNWRAPLVVMLLVSGAICYLGLRQVEKRDF